MPKYACVPHLATKSKFPALHTPNLSKYAGRSKTDSQSQQAETVVKPRHGIRIQVNVGRQFMGTTLQTIKTRRGKARARLVCDVMSTNDTKSSLPYTLSHQQLWSVMSCRRSIQCRHCLTLFHTSDCKLRSFPMQK